MSRRVTNEIAQWMQTRPEVKQVLHPALPGSPGHDIWKRDFTGSTGVFSFILHDQYGADAAARFIEALEFFGIGASWVVSVARADL